MEKQSLEVPSLKDQDFEKLLPQNLNFPGLSLLFGHMAPTHIRHIAMNMEGYTWFRYVEQESKSYILKKVATRELYRLMNRHEKRHICAGNENGILRGEKAMGLTSRGVNYKAVNEDGIGIFERKDGITLVACDGVGDCLAGEIASYVILEEFDGHGGCDARKVFASSCQRLTNLSSEICNTIPEFISFPNEVSQAAVTAVEINGNAADISQVGDVLLFHFRDDELQMLNAEGRWLSMDELEKLFADENYLTSRHIINNAVGRSYDSHWELRSLELKKGDLLILASDGLETLHPNDVAICIRECESEKGLLTRLYKMALERNLRWNTVGAPAYTKPDNISIIVYRHK